LEIFFPKNEKKKIFKNCNHYTKLCYTYKSFENVPTTKVKT
jgi:hypothetical protein